MSLSPLINYFRDCYEADNREMTLWDVFHKNIQHRIIFEKEEDLLTGFLPKKFLIDAEKAKEIKASAYMYRKEKQLFYTSLFLTGSAEDRDSRIQNLCSPIFLWPAEIIEEGEAFHLQINHAERQLNYPLLRFLCEEPGFSEEIAEGIVKQIMTEKLAFEDVALIADTFKEYFPKISTDELYLYPKLVSEKKLKMLMKKETLTLSPASGLVLLKKSAETRGVLSELQVMTQTSTFSPPIRNLFDTEKIIPEKQKAPETGKVPAILSIPQQKILASGSINPLTLAIGPPGTGKSYTIASLALAHLSRGESVLIASKMDHAVDVVGDKIESQLHMKGCIVRAGRKEYLRELKEYLEQLLQGILPYYGLDDTIENLPETIKKKRKTLDDLEAKIAHLEHDFQTYIDREKNWGELLAKDNFSFFENLYKKYIDWKIDRIAPPWEVMANLNQALSQRNEVITELIKLVHLDQIKNVLFHHRSELQNFLKAIRARTDGKQDKLFQEIDFALLLKTFPVWLTKMSDIYSVLPLRAELFDVAIIDEATQCDMASSLPIFQRAKRVVVTGDPKQLRHVSFLSYNRQKLLLEKNNLPTEDSEKFNYRDKSILDLVNEEIDNQKQVIFLDEHYRSLPQIIRFSNRHFYHDALRIMTEKPDADQKDPLKLHYCDGKRTEAGYNKAEAEAIITEVEQIINAEKHFEKNMCQSLGILSPFRDQVDYIFQRLTKKFSFRDMERHQILIGTPHSFQGEERDIMFLSFAIDPSSHLGTHYYLNKSDVFNVSITRARNQQHIYTSLHSKDIQRDTLFRRYLESAESDLKKKPEPKIIPDRFLSEVQTLLQSPDTKLWPLYSVAGLDIDIVVETKTKTFGIDLLGYPGPLAKSFPLERYKMFSRAGLHIFPLSYAWWVLRSEQTIDKLRHFLHMPVKIIHKKKVSQPEKQVLKVKLPKKKTKKSPRKKLPVNKPWQRITKMIDLYYMLGKISGFKSFGLVQLFNPVKGPFPPEIAHLDDIQALEINKRWYFNRRFTIEFIPEIGMMGDLRKLSLTDSPDLKTIPETIGRLKALRYLYLSHNAIVEVPEAISGLENLFTLELDHNQIKAIPSGIGTLKRLKYLRLQKNQIESLPSEIGNLESLQKLDLSYNNLQRLDFDIGKLQKLEYLNLKNNNLITLPKGLDKLQNLKELDISHNKLTSIPDLKILKKLKIFRTQGNPVETKKLTDDLV